MRNIYPAQGSIYILYERNPWDLPAYGAVCNTGTRGYYLRRLRDYTNWRNTWSHIVPGRFGDSESLSDFLFYDQASGVAEFYRSDDLGNLTLLRSYTDWSPGHTHIIPGHFGGSSQTGRTDLLIYNSNTTNAEFFNVWGDANMNVIRSYSDWSPGHTHIIPGDFGGASQTGQTDLLIYNSASGNAGFFRVWGDANMDVIRSYSDWSPGHTHIIPGNFGGSSQTSQTDLLIYNSASGNAEFFRVWGDANINVIRSYSDWSPGHRTLFLVISEARLKRVRQTCLFGIPTPRLQAS